MPVPADSLVGTLRFDLFDGAVPIGIAEMTTWWRKGLAEGETWDENCATLAAALLDGWQSNVHGELYSTAVHLRDATAIHPAPDGSALNKQIAAGATWVGSGNAQSLPWETSLVVSLYTYTPGTFVSHGRRRRGRNYLPPMDSGVLAGANSGFVSTATRDEALADHKSFLMAVRQSGSDDTQYALSVYSRVDGLLHLVTDLACDVRMDSQRRRERKQLPPKVSVGFPQGA